MSTISSPGVPEIPSQLHSPQSLTTSRRRRNPENLHRPLAWLGFPGRRLACMPRASQHPIPAPPAVHPLPALPFSSLPPLHSVILRRSAIGPSSLSATQGEIMSSCIARWQTVAANCWRPHISPDGREPPLQIDPLHGRQLSAETQVNIWRRSAQS
jgi:hypothetical protein